MVRLDWMTKEEREKWDSMPADERHRINMAMADQFEISRSMREELERQHNSPERVARRERIAQHIGRPLNTDMVKGDPRWDEYKAGSILNMAIDARER
jgi:hypothetical protein